MTLHPERHRRGADPIPTKNKKPTKRGLLVHLLLFIRFSIKRHADRHDNGEDDQIEQHRESELAQGSGSLIRADTVGIDGDEHHKKRRQDGKQRHDDIFEDMLSAFLYDEHDKHGNVEGVDGDDWQLGGIKAEHAKDGGTQIGAVEVEIPTGAKQQRQNACVCRHIGLRIDRAEHLGLGAAAAHGQGVKGTRARDHKSVERTKAGDDDKGIEHRTAHAAKQISDGGHRALGHEHLHRRAARQTNEIQHVDAHNHGRANEQRAGQIALGIF